MTFRDRFTAWTQNPPLDQSRQYIEVSINHGVTWYPDVTRRTNPIARELAARPGGVVKLGDVWYRTPRD